MARLLWRSIILPQAIFIVLGSEQQQPDWLAGCCTKIFYPTQTSIPCPDGKSFYCEYMQYEHIQKYLCSLFQLVSLKKMFYGVASPLLQVTVICSIFFMGNCSSFLVIEDTSLTIFIVWLFLMISEYLLMRNITSRGWHEEEVGSRIMCF